MSSYSGPAVLTNGLVLDLDMSNTQKSWIGAPTTNLVPYPYANWTGSAFATAYLYDATSTHTFTYVTGVTNPINSPGVLRYYTGTAGYKYWSLRVTGLSAGTYTFTYYARISKGPSNSSNLALAQIWRDSDVTDRTPTGDWNPTFTGDWKRFTLTSTITGTYFDMFMFHSGSMTGDYTLDLCGFQFELASVASTFVAGSRSSTAAILDITNTLPLNAVSLTYASDNTFSFNGTSNYIGASTTAAIQFLNRSPYTLEVWVKPSSNPGASTYKGLIVQESLLPVSSNRDGYNLWYGGSAGTDVYFYSERFVNGVQQNAATTVTQSLVINIWQHIVAVYDGTTITLYRNGVAVNSSASATGNITGTTGQLVIGNLYGNWYSGQIGVERIYNIALTASQVAQNFNALRGRYGI